MTTTEGLQPAQNGCEAVVPRQRQRGRGTTKTRKDPAALAAGNGHSKATAQAVAAAVAVAEPEPQPAKRPRRRFQRLTIGFPIVVTDGYVKRWRDEILVFLGEDWREKGWVPVEDANQYEVVLDRWTRRPSYRRVRLLNEEGFPTTFRTGWIETDRWISEPTVIKFEEGAPLPIMIGSASLREQRHHPDECVGGYRLIYPKPPNPPRKIEWFPASDREKRKVFLASLPEASAEIKAALDAPPEPVEIMDQWFRVELPPVEYHFFDRETDETIYISPAANLEYPGGWPCKLVQPQPLWKVCREKEYNPQTNKKEAFKVRAVPDSSTVYVQFSHHCTTWDQKWSHRHDCWEWVPRQLTDDGSEGTLPCGMWVPKHLIKPIGTKEADLRWRAVEAAYEYKVTFEDALVWLESQK